MGVCNPSDNGNELDALMDAASYEKFVSEESQGKGWLKCVTHVGTQTVRVQGSAPAVVGPLVQ